MILKFSKNIYDDKLLSVYSGDTKAANYSLSLDKETAQECLVADEYDIQEVIDSYAEQCSIARIIALNGLGDAEVLNIKPGVYLDEEQVKLTSLSNDENALHVELFKLYAPYQERMSYDEFANAVMHGNFKALEIPKATTTEESANA